MIRKVMASAPSAETLRRAGAGLAAVCLLAAAAPAALHRLETQRDNAEWRDRAGMFVEAFALDAGAGSQGFTLADPSEERLWRMARAYDTVLHLDAMTRDRDAIGVYQTFARAHFDQAQRQAQERKCLAQAVYYEARSESRQGQIAVAEVVLNRVRHPLYPDSICDVVFQGSDRVTGCQFTFTCDGSMRRDPRGWAWSNANRIAVHAMLGFEDGGATNGATHYHTVAVQPYWSETLVRTRVVGSHIFYRFPGAAGRLPARGETPA